MSACPHKRSRFHSSMCWYSDYVQWVSIRIPSVQLHFVNIPMEHVSQDIDRMANGFEIPIIGKASALQDGTGGPIGSHWRPLARCHRTWTSLQPL